MKVIVKVYKIGSSEMVITVHSPSLSNLWMGWLIGSADDCKILEDEA